ncbi:CpsD/CapB family tyrosine-protein kinase [Murimonas intestini]|uniref:CpsD/CapB family tyrosine-protein kinase n=1 Tax=Murimonas intestini TaxID=1337051 RepID=UPI0011DCEA90|nr:CpsD/CapB family tyrosine-protein kinase [Murimonas intestini]
MQDDLQRGLYDDEIAMDLGGMMDDYLRCFRRYWMQIILALAAVTAATVLYLNITYQPVYEAKITYSVTKTGDTAIDASIAKRLSQTAPGIITGVEFTKEMLAMVEGETINPNYKITASNTEGANLFTITVSANNYLNADTIADLLEVIYPEWASRSSGTVEMQVVDRVESGGVPVNSYSLVDSIVKGIIYGLAFCFICATGYVLTIKTVRKESDMKKITDLGCLALVPEVRFKKRKNKKRNQLLINKKRVDLSFKQSVLSAQQRLEKRLEQSDKKVLLISSALPQEGKSVLSVNLALAFSERGKKTILIDADMRSPSVSSILETDPGKNGLGEYLTGKAGQDNILVRITENLHLIPAGKIKGELSVILDNDRMEKLMEQLKVSYDFIIIDTPPSHMFGDAALMMRYTDASVYVVRYDYAEINEIREGIAEVNQGQKLMGYLLNRGQRGISSYGGYGYGRYGYYGKYEKYSRYVQNSEEEELDTESTL